MVSPARGGVSPTQFTAPPVAYDELARWAQSQNVLHGLGVDASDETAIRDILAVNRSFALRLTGLYWATHTD